jgi:hypothetical protein
MTLAKSSLQVLAFLIRDKVRIVYPVAVREVRALAIFLG